jgi:hypothetical protein
MGGAPGGEPGRRASALADRALPLRLLLLLLLLSPLPPPQLPDGVRTAAISLREQPQAYLLPASPLAMFSKRLETNVTDVAHRQVLFYCFDLVTLSGA